MFCINCGTQNDDDSVFCLKCGAKLTTQSQQQVQSQPNAQPVNNQAQTNAAPNQNIASAQNQQANFQQQMPNNVNAPVREGCLSAAWHDITSTSGWFKKILIMALFNLIPFLNYGIIGFAQNWGADVAKGKREQMPQQIFNTRNFLTGLFEKLTFVVLGFVYIAGTILVWATLGNIPILGVILIFGLLVFSIFYNSFISLAAMKAALNTELGESFRIKKILSALKRNFGGVFLSYFLPSLICGVICIIIVAILVAIFTTSAASSFTAISSMFTPSKYGYSSDPFAIFNNLGSAFGALSSLAALGTTLIAIGVVLICITTCITGVIEKLLRYRSIGHWIATFAPEWVDDHEERPLKLNK